MPSLATTLQKYDAPQASFPAGTTQLRLDVTPDDATKAPVLSYTWNW